MRTKGKWQARFPVDPNESPWISDEEGEAIARLYGSDDEARANAHCLAAATDMLEALEAIQSISHGGDSDIYQIAGAAIAKAKAAA